ncbi:BspA family leucine-rich repeat surface protein [Thiomicrospira microaerophila]|uniref:BspA family leucine-rich repeat surface protein n=1 Tax=Thiomicrospira microaerophila TaxID=406020 RepID=UPI0006974F0B|nr:BspA family leucine-rich repeat surface protein [Thiomicrospira microaerophila]
MQYNFTAIIHNNLSILRIPEGMVAQVIGASSATRISLEQGASFDFKGVFAPNQFVLHGAPADWQVSSQGSHALLTHRLGDQVMIPASATITQTISFDDSEDEFALKINTDQVEPVINLGELTLSADNQVVGAIFDPVRDNYLIVTEQQLRDAVEDGSYAISHKGTYYTLEDSDYNVDTSQVTSMYGLFKDDDFNGDIGYWDVSSVTNMAWMFEGAKQFNQDISGWNTSNVKDFGGTFALADAFNQPIGNWDTSGSENMSWMFAQAYAFNQPIGDWNTSNVTNMNWMLGQATSFNQEIETWDTSAVVNMADMFKGATSFNKSLKDWDVSRVESMDGMLWDAVSFNQDLSEWQTDSLTNMPPENFANYLTEVYYPDAWLIG